MNLLLRNLRLAHRGFALTLDLEANGKVIGIFGPSGAGKTSLLETVAGLRRPETGLIRIDGTVLLDCAAGIFVSPERRGVGYVPQDLALFPHLSVRDNINYGRRGTASAGIAFDPVVDLLEIGELLDRSVGQLSGGQKQRVAFARALLAQPRLLLMDEPLTGLDHDLKLKIVPYLRRIRDELAIPLIYVSHSPEELADLCDQVLLLQDGKSRGLRAPSEIFEPSASMTVRPGLLR